MELDDEYTPEPSKPLNEASIRLINLIIYSHVPEEKFRRDYSEDE